MRKAQYDELRALERRLISALDAQSKLLAENKRLRNEISKYLPLIEAARKYVNDVEALYKRNATAQHNRRQGDESI